MQEQFFFPKLVSKPQDKESNVVRILNPRPLQFNEVFVVKKDEAGEVVKREDGTPRVMPFRRLLSDGKIEASEVQKANPTDKVREIDCYIVFNYAENRLQIWSISQYTVKDALKALAAEAALSSKTISDFDLTIVKSGDGTITNTNYSVEVDRLKGKLVFTKLDKQIEEFFNYCKPNIKGYLMLSNEHPLQGDAAEPMPKDVKKIFALLKSGKITVDTLRKETDIVVAKMLFRELAKQAAENKDNPGYLIDGDVLMSLDEIKQIRDEIITPF